MNILLLQYTAESTENPDAFGLILTAALVIGFTLFFIILFTNTNSKNSTRKNKSSKQLCQYCESQINTAKKFCPQCGYPSEEKLDNKRLCTSCKEVNSIEASFCQECGDKLQNHHTSSDTQIYWWVRYELQY